MARPTKAQQAAIAERRRSALNLRVAGVEPSAIGAKLHADPTFNTDQLAYPMGYGIERYEQGREPLSGKKLIVRVCQDLQIVMQARHDALAEDVEAKRLLENERLDAYQRAIHARALGIGSKDGADLEAMGMALKIMDQRRKLNGYEVPVEPAGGPAGNPITVTINPMLLPPRMDEDQPDAEAEPGQ